MVHYRKRIMKLFGFLIIAIIFGGMLVSQVGISYAQTGSNQTMQNSINMSGTGAATKPSVNATISTTASVTATTSANNTNNLGGQIQKILSPRAQVATGIDPSHVKCDQGYDLVLNSFDSRPACIKSDHVAAFTARSWGQSV